MQDALESLVARESVQELHHQNKQEVCSLSVQDVCLGPSVGRQGARVWNEESGFHLCSSDQLLNMSWTESSTFENEMAETSWSLVLTVEL